MFHCWFCGRGFAEQFFLDGGVQGGVAEDVAEDPEAHFIRVAVYAGEGSARNVNEREGG